MAEQYKVKAVVVNITTSAPDAKQHVWVQFREGTTLEVDEARGITQAELDRLVSLDAIVPVSAEKVAATPPETPVAPPSELSSLSYNELQAKAKELDLPATGTQAELLQRVQEKLAAS